MSKKAENSKPTQHDDRENRIYIRETSEWMPVSPAFYKDYCKKIGAYRRGRQRHGECFCPRKKWWYCNMVCFDCKYSRTEDTVSLDDAATVADTEDITIADCIASDAPSLDEIVILSETLDALHEELERLAPEDRAICELIGQGKSERDGAKALGMNASTFRRHWLKVRALLYERLKSYV